MRRSRQVLAPLLASTAVALLAGCHGPEMQRCVDESNHVVDPSFCKNLPAHGTQPVYSGSGGGAGVLLLPHMYHYYYGGGGSYAPGTVVSGGGYVPSSGRSYSTTAGTARGGFGSSFSGHGGEGHGGEGGSHGGGGAGE